VRRVPQLAALQWVLNGRSTAANGVTERYPSVQPLTLRKMLQQVADSSSARMRRGLFIRNRPGPPSAGFIASGIADFKVATGPILWPVSSLIRLFAGSYRYVRDIGAL
jgi:hypothetical protein